VLHGAEFLADDPRVRAILTEPDAYFSAALRRAWPQARADIEQQLDRRGRNRRDGTPALRFLRMLLGLVTA
jgi:hypothetical protein